VASGKTDVVTVGSHESERWFCFERAARRLRLSSPIRDSMLVRRLRLLVVLALLALVVACHGTSPPAPPAFNVGQCPISIADAGVVWVTPELAQFVACMRRAGADTVTPRLRASLGGRSVASVTPEAQGGLIVDSIDEALEKYPFEHPEWEPVRECGAKLQTESTRDCGTAADASALRR
jgi:hypothetical protein